MANTLGVYNPIFYAQEALIQLEKALGLASRVHMGFDAERKAFGLGDTINIRRPSTFTVEDAPATARDVTTETTSLSLDKWREVKFKLTDKELAFTGERIINDHIRPAAYALADDIDTKLRDLYHLFPSFSVGSAPVVAADLTQVRASMFANQVPLQDVGNIHMMVGGQEEMELMNLEAFSQYQGAGDAGVNTQLRGSLGMKYGMEIFANQNVKNLAAGDVSTMADAVGAIDNGGTAYAAGDTSIALTGLTNSATIKVGDSIQVGSAGAYKTYAVTTAATVHASANTVTVVISPGVKKADVAAFANAEVVTVLKQSAGNQCLAFHKNSMALAMAPLSEMGNELGANIATVQDPITGLSLRSRVYYVGDSSEVHVALDVLYGVQVLDGQLGHRMSA
tara:strand:+ start:1345 stop:2529 length:1185 start_codon:yes stop_codon:yes gene_type:complete